jgi:hypothetical protein
LPSSWNRDTQIYLYPLPSLFLAFVAFFALTAYYVCAFFTIVI